MNDQVIIEDNRRPPSPWASWLKWGFLILVVILLIYFLKDYLFMKEYNLDVPAPSEGVLEPMSITQGQQ